MALTPIPHAVVAASAAKSPHIDLLGPLLHGLAIGFIASWPLWLLVAAGAAGKLALHLYEIRRVSRSGIAEVDRMTGAEFELFLTTLFRRLGGRVEHTGRRGDYGADLVVTKDGYRIAVQAKRWNRAVGVTAVQEAVAAKGIYNCTNALVVTNRTFTRQAQALAKANGVTLWDRDALLTKLLSAGSFGQPSTGPV